MDLKLNHIAWVGNIYQKFEAVRQEVDDLVGQDAVKYLENQVHNVGDTVKRFYSDVVQELLPLSPLVNSAKLGDCSATSKNNVVSSFKSCAGVIDNNEKGDKDSPVNDFIEPFQDCNAINPANDQQAYGSIKLDLVNHVSDETSSNSLEVENSDITQEEIDDDDSRETSGAIKEKLHASIEQNAEKLHVSIEQNAVECAPQLLNLISSKEKFPLECSILSESLSGSSESGHVALAGTKNNSDVSIEQTSCLIVKEHAIESSTSQVMNFTTLGEEGSFFASLVSELSDGVDDDSCGILAEVSPSSSFVDLKSQSSTKAGIVIDKIKGRDECLSGNCFSESSDTLASPEVAYLTMSCGKSLMKIKPSCLKSSLQSDIVSSKSQGSYSSEIESSKNNSVDVAGCISDSSFVLVSCEPTGQIMASRDAPVSSSSGQSMESNEGQTFGVNEVMSLNNSCAIRHGQICSTDDRAMISLSDIDQSLVSSIESSMEDIQLSDNAKREESCVFVDDSELYAVSRRAQRLRSYKKRIQDAFASKKRLAKEYEQLAIWYGDTDMELRQGTSLTLFPFNSKRISESKDLQGQHEFETDWELL